MIKKISFALAIASLLILIISCSMDPVAGGSDMPNGIVSGTVVDTVGSPVSGTKIYLIPEKYNPVIDEPISSSMIDTTDENGTYTFIEPKPGVYNIFGIHLTKTANLLIPGVKVRTDSTTVPADTLSKPGIVKVFLPDTVDTALGYLFIQGTPLYKKLSEATGLNESGYLLVLDSVPEASFTSLYYNLINKPSLQVPILTDTLEVFSNDTAETHAFISWVHYTKEELILLDNHVSDILISSDNVKWFATNFGLLTYDGSTWNYILTNNSGIPSYVVHRVIRDNRGKIWVATDRGAAINDNGEWLIFDTNTAFLPSNYVTDIAVDSSSDLWFGMHGGIAKFQYRDSTFVMYDTNNSNLPSYMMHAVTVDSRNHVWFGTEAGVLEFDGSTWQTYNTGNSGITSNNVYCLTMDSDNALWFGYNGGVCRFDGSNWKPYDERDSKLLKDTVVTIYSNNDDIWIGTSIGLTKYNGKKWKDFSGELYKLLDNTSILSIAKDSGENMWVGSLDKGVIGFGPTIK